MSNLFEWKVLRRHDGDRLYEEGETRIGTKLDLGHLSPKTLQLIGPARERKAETPPLNKAERAAANKASTGRKAT